jgi:TPR repeat protein
MRHLSALLPRRCVSSPGLLLPVLLLLAGCARCGAQQLPDVLTPPPAGTTASLSREALQRDCQAGRFQACQALTRRDVPIETLQADCVAGQASPCFELGVRLQEGRVTPRAVRQALSHLLSACEAGHPVACGLSGESVWQGVDGELDVERALALLQRGCDGGDLVSCSLLAKKY